MRLIDAENCIEISPLKLDGAFVTAARNGGHLPESHRCGAVRSQGHHFVMQTTSLYFQLVRSSSLSGFGLAIVGLSEGVAEDSWKKHFAWGQIRGFV